MRLKTKFMNQVLAAVLTIAAAVAGHTSAWAQGISVTSSTSGTTTTFTITRSGSVLPAQTVNYRTVALSAFPGQNFNAVSGTLSFAANETSKTVTVTEKTPAASSKFGYSAGATSGYRNYRFEVLDLNGFLLAYRKRNWQVTGVITRAASGTRDYLYANGTQLRMTLELRAYEFDDGYLYLQVLTDNTSTCDNRSGCSNGDPGNISLSRYMAGFEMDKGDAYTTYKTYTFPVLSVGSGVGATDP